MRRAKLIAGAFVTALAGALACSLDAIAAPQQLTCVLSNVGDQPSSQNQTIMVIFDDSAKTLQAQFGGQNYSLGNVSISNVAISGDVGAVSLGIDRSSLGMVWQQYQPDKVITNFGQCRANAGAGAAP